MKINFTRKHLFITLGIIFICAASFTLGWVANSRLGNSDVRLITSAHQLLSNESLYNDQTSRDLSYAAIRGMLSVIDDPFAELIEPEAAQDLINTFAGKTGVVGLYAENQGGQVVIVNIFPDSPAEIAGLQAGDVILSIDGKPLDEDADSSETGLLIRGTPGLPVSIEIQRNDSVQEYELIRQEREFVASRMLPDNIGYISLNAFNAVASQEMKQALEAMLELEPTALVWDLRNNEGGDMQAAQEIISYFIEEGLLFSAELTRDRSVQFFAKGDAFAAEIPLVVLIDESSYSAAETAAAAIAETGRGTTIGSASYGKGLIQATMPMVDEALLQLTIAKWLSHDGEWYHERGVMPQIEISDNPDTDADEVLQKAVELLLSNP